MNIMVHRYNCRFVPPYKRIWRKYNYIKLIKKYFSECESILDIGAGDCIFEECCEELGKEVIGVDINKKFQRRNIMIKDYREITDKYDGVFVGCLLYSINQFELMDAVSSICRKRCVIVENMPFDKAIWNSTPAIRPWSREGVVGLFNGYSSLKTIESGYFIPFLPFFSKNKHFVVAEQSKNGK